MNLQETAQLLSTIAAFSNRTVERSAVIAWQSVLDDISLADAEEAVRRHYAASAEWMMPVHIRQGAAEVAEERERAARATGYAPGQWGVPAAEAIPELVGSVDESALAPSVRALLAELRAKLADGSRETLMPRAVAWEREHKAFLRTRDGEPNPLYKPTALPVQPLSGMCGACGAESQDLGRHRLDYPNGSCATA